MPQPDNRTSPGPGSSPGYAAKSKDVADPFDDLIIGWKDGLPKDRAEESTIETTLVSSGLTSRYSAIKRLNDGDDDATLQEMEKIEEEQAQQQLGAMATAGGQVPAGDNLAQSAQLVAQLRGGQGGGTQTPEEGGPKR